MEAGEGSTVLRTLPGAEEGIRYLLASRCTGLLGVSWSFPQGENRAASRVCRGLAAMTELASLMIKKALRGLGIHVRNMYT